MKPRKQTRTSRIMVPTDFSPGSAEVLESAIALAKRLKADLILAHVIEPFPYNNGGLP
ncbi:MAG: universal stress protein [Candidatus Manganitrophus sp. SA1]|nr:universal stress protein [Candidatus Manganitrophus morganii]